MIDAERMLRSLVQSALSEGAGLGRGGRRGRRRRRRGSFRGRASRGALAMGALGVALGAWEHFRQKEARAAATPPGPRQPPPPPPSPPAPTTGDPPPLPPLPVTAPATPTPAANETGGEALLLVRAMIAAANADHQLDDDERARIERALDEAEGGEEEKAFLRAELDSPIEPGALAEQATNPELATQVYLASCLAIEVDSRAERDYLDELARRLGLDPEQAAELETQLEQTMDEGSPGGAES